MGYPCGSCHACSASSHTAQCARLCMPLSTPSSLPPLCIQWPPLSMLFLSPPCTQSVVRQRHRFLYGHDSPLVPAIARALMGESASDGVSTWGASDGASGGYRPRPSDGNHGGAVNESEADAGPVQSNDARAGSAGGGVDAGVAGGSAGAGAGESGWLHRRPVFAYGVGRSAVVASEDERGRPWRAVCRDVGVGDPGGAQVRGGGGHVVEGGGGGGHGGEMGWGACVRVVGMIGGCMGEGEMGGMVRVVEGVGVARGTAAVIGDQSALLIPSPPHLPPPFPSPISPPPHPLSLPTPPTLSSSDPLFSPPPFLRSPTGCAVGF